MRALTDTLCNTCGNPNVFKGETQVRYQSGQVTACEECDDGLGRAQEANYEVDDDPAKVRAVTFKCLAKTYSSASWSVYVCDPRFQGERPAWIPSELHLGFKAVRAMTVVGQLDGVERGDVFTILGRICVDKKFGIQFKALSSPWFSFDYVEGVLGFVRNVCDHVVTLPKGKGLEDVLRWFDDLESKCPFDQTLTSEARSLLSQALESREDQLEILRWAAENEIPSDVLERLIETYDDAVDAVTNDPFVLLECGANLKTTDDYFLRCGGHAEDPRRIRAYIWKRLEDAIENSGSTYVNLNELDLSRFDAAQITHALAQEAPKGKFSFRVWVEDGITFLSPSYLANAEESAAKKLQRLFDLKPEPISSASLMLPESTATEQRRAIENALNFPVSIITGGGGVGKTWVIRVLAEHFERCGKSYYLAAPTGKAARRISEMTGFPAYTIHSLILQEKRAEILILDETSMCDAELLNKLIDVSLGRIVFVGDANQLPSVGAGSVLRDLIESEIFPVTRLTQVFRQDEGSRIIDVASRVLQGDSSIDLSVRNSDLSFVELPTSEDVAEAIVKAVVSVIPEKRGFASFDIQVLCPQKTEAIGSRALNQKLQAILNPKMKRGEVKIGDGSVARVNDRVIHIKNNYELQVSNGDVGIVTDVSVSGMKPKSDVLTSDQTDEGRRKKHTKKKDAHLIHAIVQFPDGRKIGYHRDELRDLQLAYALSIHKFQGSQSPAIVVPIHSSNGYMLDRNLIYTAITRASKFCLLIGQSKAFKQGIKKVHVFRRRTKLKAYLTPDRMLVNLDDENKP